MIQLIHGDARKIPLGAKSVHCVVTSPPYFNLRDYGVAGQIGNEPSPRTYVDNLVDVFREVYRVLRDDGTVWLNIGDTYVQKTIGGRDKFKPGDKQASNLGSSFSTRKLVYSDNLDSKDLFGIPWRVAFALQETGWYLRSDIIWHNPNRMPHSVLDRPVCAHEYVFLLTKSKEYFYDYFAIREPATDAVDRNKRDVWRIPGQTFSGDHFAAFPEKLVIPCIKAGTSWRGCCPKCGTPWSRDVEKERFSTRSGDNVKIDKTNKANLSSTRTITTMKSKGWIQGCKCVDGVPDFPGSNKIVTMHEPIPIPCTVLDPFCGSGTTGVVAQKLGRKFVGIDINESYVEMAKKRIGEPPIDFGLDI